MQAGTESGLDLDGSGDGEKEQIQFTGLRDAESCEPWWDSLMYKPVDSFLLRGTTAGQVDIAWARTPSPFRPPRWKATASEGCLVTPEGKPGDPASGCNVEEHQRLTAC